MVEPLFPAAGPPDDVRPALGYGMVVAAALLFGFNGAVSKVILKSGLDSLRLTEVRSTGAALGLLLGALALAPGRLRLARSELPYFAAFGVLGVACVQLFYFLAIHRLPVGIGLLLE